MLTLAEIAKLNAGEGHVERLHKYQETVRRNDLPAPPTGDAGAELGIARVALVGLKLRDDPIRRQADVDVSVVTDGETYALDVGGSTATTTSGSPASVDGILSGLKNSVLQLSEPVLAETEDPDGDGNAENLHLEGNWNRITITAAQSEDYTVAMRDAIATITSDGSLTGADLVDDIATKLRDEITSRSDLADARAPDFDADGLADVLYVSPTSPAPLRLSVSATGSGGLTIDAAGDASDMTYKWNSGSSTGSAELDVARDATSVTAEAWARSSSWSTWQKINGMDKIQAPDNWVENLQSLSDIDRGFLRVTATDGRVTPVWAPALG